jgi:membrane protein
MALAEPGGPPLSERLATWLQVGWYLTTRARPEVPMFGAFDIAVTWTELLKRTVREIMQDDAQSLAAQLAYYFFLALFPALLCVVALASLFPLENFTDEVVRRLAPIAPPEAIGIIERQMKSLSEGNNTGLLSIGLLGALWTSSAAMVAIVHAMNRAYDIQESRPWWKVRLVAIALTIGLALFILLSFTLIVAGPEIAEGLASRLGLGGAFVATWNILQWPVAFGLVVFGFGLIYYFAPDADQDWVWVTPGSLLATSLWVLGSVGFRIYAVNFGNYEAAYGAIGGIILLLLWFYLSGFVIVVGAEMNAEIEHTSPWGKAPGEKHFGERKKIGVAAARAYRERAQAVPKPPGRPLELPPYVAPSFLERAFSYATLFLRWKNRRRS